jgi:hypothetical protein
MMQLLRSDAGMVRHQAGDMGTRPIDPVAPDRVRHEHESVPFEAVD